MDGLFHILINKIAEIKRLNADKESINHRIDRLLSEIYKAIDERAKAVDKKVLQHQQEDGR